MSTLESFTNRGLQLLTQWAQITEQLMDYAAVFEARGGAGAFEAAKYTGDNHFVMAIVSQFNAPRQARVFPGVGVDIYFLAPVQCGNNARRFFVRRTHNKRHHCTLRWIPGRWPWYKFIGIQMPKRHLFAFLYK